MRLDEVPEAAAVDVVHDECERISLDDDVVHLDDVRSRGLLEGASLLEESIYDAALVGYGLVQDLEGERLRRLFCMTFPDFSLSPRSDLLVQYVGVAEVLRGWRFCHEICLIPRRRYERGTSLVRARVPESEGRCTSP